MIIGFGALLVHWHRTTIGTVSAFVLFLAYLIDPIQQFSQLFNLVQQSGAALKKLFGLLDTDADRLRAPRRGRAAGQGRAGGRRGQLLLPPRRDRDSARTT